MNLIAFSIYDSKLEQFTPPFFMNTRPQALRAFGDHVNDKDQPINRHPEDYHLYELGTLDTDNGRLEPAASVLRLANAKDYWHETEANQLDITDAIQRKLKKGA